MSLERTRWLWDYVKTRLELHTLHICADPPQLALGHDDSFRSPMFRKWIFMCFAFCRFSGYGLGTWTALVLRNTVFTIDFQVSVLPSPLSTLWTYFESRRLAAGRLEAGWASMGLGYSFLPQRTFLYCQLQYHLMPPSWSHTVKHVLECSGYTAEHLAAQSRSELRWDVFLWSVGYLFSVVVVYQRFGSS